MIKIIHCTECDLSNIIEMLSGAEDYCNWTENILTATFLNTSNFFLKACGRDGMLDGFIGVEVILDEAEITNVFVCSHQRKKGTGGLLVSAAIEKCRSCGVKRIFLEVHEKNIPAIKLYQKLDFEQIAQRKGYYGKETACVYSRKL